jgi:hypothetical protein
MEKSILKVIWQREPEYYLFGGMMMKEFIKYLLGGAITILLVLIIMLIPPSFFLIKDNNIVDRGKEVIIEPVDVQGDNILSMTMKEKADMVNEAENIETVQLKTGDVYSLYEARLQSFRELCKIPSLEADIYGPVKDEIEIQPFLIIDAKSPSRKMIVWKGRLTIKGAEYKIVLDEETGKILNIESPEWKNKELIDKVLKEWEKYISDD